MSGTARRSLQKGLAKAESKDHLQAQTKLTEVVDGRRRIVHTPPLLARVELPDQQDFIRDTFNDYLSTLPPERQHLLRRYHYADVALKVVGVGSVGTRCFIVLLHGRDDADPLFLQVKEASESVLAKHLAPSEYANQGQRVVEGQRLMQAASDTFLGWIVGRGDEHRHFYWRQLHDVKGSADLEVILPEGLILYSEVCGAALAGAHARSGDAAMITGYIGTGSAFATRGVFAEAYADQTNATTPSGRGHQGRVGGGPGGHLRPRARQPAGSPAHSRAWRLAPQAARASGEGPDGGHRRHTYQRRARRGAGKPSPMAIAGGRCCA